MSPYKLGKTLDEANNKEKERQVLIDVADMLVDREFQEELKHSDVAEIESKVQSFLA